MPNRRRDAATAGTGYALVGAGGALRGRAIDAAHRELGLGNERLKPSSLAVYGVHRRRPGVKGELRPVAEAAKIVRRFAAGSALVTAGAPAAGLGTYELLKHRRQTVAKAQHKPLIIEGAQGAGDAWRQKGRSLRSGAPVHTRSIPIALGAVGAAGGALVTHRGLDTVGRLVRREVKGGARSALTAIGAVPGSLATIPVSRRLTRRSGYTVTPTGTQRVTKASQDYRGRHVRYAQQRAATMSVGATPIVGPLLAARQAGSYAPPGQEHHARDRQLLAGGAGAVAATVGARRGYQFAAHSPRFKRASQRAYEATQRQEAKLPKAIHHFTRMKPYAELGERGPRVAAAFLGAKLAGPAIGIPASQIAISRDITAQRRYDKHRRYATPSANVRKADSSLSVPQQRRLVRRKHLSANLTTAGGVLGLTALGMVGAKDPAVIARRNKLLAIGAGVGGANALNSGGVARREAKIQREQITKALGGGYYLVSKAAPIQTTMNDHEAHKLVHGKGGYGLTGPLPKQLDRPARKQAYEARYIASGGKKANRWQHIANAGTNTANAGVAGATLSGLALMASKSPRARKIAAPLHALKHFEHLNSDAVKEKAEHAAVAAATMGGIGQLTAQGAKRRRASYASAPGGVAASALRRMNAYTPQ